MIGMLIRQIAAKSRYDDTVQRTRRYMAHLMQRAEPLMRVCDAIHLHLASTQGGLLAIPRADGKRLNDLASNQSLSKDCYA